jgi:phospholipid N-methyltransferase
MTSAARLVDATTVLELGPGTGIVTERILEELPAGARFLALEINPAFAAATRRRCPGAQVEVDDAANARRHLETMGQTHFDAVLSGLPWASFTAPHQDRLLGAIHDVLRPGGRFVTFAYVQGLLLPAAHRFERRLRRNFDSVHTTPIVWRNLPPAFAYVAAR